MADGRTAHRLIRVIDRYQATRAAHGARSRCNFEPSCSHFAQDTLHARALPIAIASSAWRIVRCNALIPVRSADPVRRPHGRRMRPNGVATALALVSVVGLVLIVGTPAVGAQSIEGGCVATINGRDPATMTVSDPVVVHKGEKVAISGTVPPSVAPAGDQIKSVTKITVSIVGGVATVSSEEHPGTGPEWGTSVNVDDYLKWGVGLYKVEGSSSGEPGGWSCSGDGYIELRDGSPLGKPIGMAAAGMTALGVIGAVAAAGIGRTPPTGEPAPTAEEVQREFGSDAEKVLGIQDQPPRPERYLDAGLSLGCSFAVFVAILIFVAIGDGVLAALPVAAAVAAGPKLRRRIWVRGHPVLGFFSGLVAGLGIAVLVQQYAYWPLTIGTALVFPVLVAVLTTLRAWRGRPFAIPAA